MTTSMNQTVWLPRRFSYVHFSLERFAISVVMPPSHKQISMGDSVQEQVRHHCYGHCNLFKEASSILTEARARGITIPSGGDTKAAVKQVAATMGVCPGYVYAQQCVLNKTFGNEQFLEVEVPGLIYEERMRARTDKYYIYEYEETPTKLLRQSFVFPNVHANGMVCWGTHNRKPKTLRAALQLYWSAPFNGDLFLYSHAASLRDAIQARTPNSASWVDATEEYFGDPAKTLIRNTHADAFLLTKDPKALSQLPSSYQWHTPEGHVGLAWVRQGGPKQWFLSFMHVEDRDPASVLLGIKNTAKPGASAKITLLGPVGKLV